MTKVLFKKLKANSLQVGNNYTQGQWVWEERKKLLLLSLTIKIGPSHHMKYNGDWILCNFTRVEYIGHPGIDSCESQANRADVESSHLGVF